MYRKSLRVGKFPVFEDHSWLKHFNGVVDSMVFGNK